MTTTAPNSAPNGPSVQNLKGALTRVSQKDEAEESESRPLDFRLISRLMAHTQPYRGLRNSLLVLVFIRSVQLPTLTWLLVAVINGPIAQRDTSGVFLGAVAFLALAASTQIVMHFRQRYAAQLGEHVVHDLRVQLFSHLQTFPMQWYNKTKVGRVISRVVSDIEDVRVGVQEVLYVCLVQIGQMLIAAGFMLWYDRVLFLIVLGLVPILWGINHYFHRILSVVLRQMRESFSRVTATMAESVNGMRVTQAFVRQDRNAVLFRELVADHSRYNTRVMETHGLFLPLLEFNSQLFVAILLVVGGARVLAPESTTPVGELVGFLLMANMFFAPITVLGNQYNQAMQTMAGAERLFNLLDRPPDWKDSADAVAAPELQGGIEFRDVSFSYDPGRPVLRNVSFRVSPGQTVALVGHTGSGKTTIASLLAKFYLPTHGEIILDSYPLSGLTAASIHQQLGLVLQQNFLFHGTVESNILFANPIATSADVQQVCRQLGCLEMLQSLPNGLKTEVGERGNLLSIGQRQMICFARALLADPKILILDEATSSIDAATESQIQTALATLLAGRTSVVIAHRLSTIQAADLIVVVDQGQIVEQGRHHQLIESGGHYARLHARFQSAQKRGERLGKMPTGPTDPLALAPR